MGVLICAFSSNLRIINANSFDLMKAYIVLSDSRSAHSFIYCGRYCSALENKRSKEDIVAKILETSLAPANQTAIMYSANLSFSQLRYYVRLLDERHLIEKKEGKWSTTQRGRQYLKAYEELQTIITDSAEKPVSARN